VDLLGAHRRGAILQASLDFAADPALMAAFPFAHLVTLTVELTEESLALSTTVEATGGEPVPIAFGFHPYFRVPGDRRAWEISLPLRRHLELDARSLPSGRGRREPAASLRLGEQALDDAFDGIRDGARFSVRGGGRTVTVSHDEGFPVAQLFSPRGAQFICFEPMTAPVDALRSGSGLRETAPGSPFKATWSVTVGR
jgi:galactose mutarotase-like enzyme